MPQSEDKISICSLVALSMKVESWLCQGLLASLTNPILLGGVCAILKALKLHYARQLSWLQQVIK